MYIDGYILPMQKKSVPAYRRIAAKAAKVFLEHGAVEVMECAGDDLKSKWGIPFPRAMKLKAGETVVFSWVVYKSKAQRDRVNAKVMKDPRMDADPSTMPFDMKRMSYGGFKVIVNAR
jgi:uncharacterized protein YbaA (DUF1428 family)